MKIVFWELCSIIAFAKHIQIQYNLKGWKKTDHNLSGKIFRIQGAKIAEYIPYKLGFLSNPKTLTKLVRYTKSDISKDSKVHFQ